MVLWTSVSSYTRLVVRCMGVGLSTVGLAWVMGPQVHLTVDWISYFVGLVGVWVDEMDPRTTFVCCTEQTGQCHAIGNRLVDRKVTGPSVWNNPPDWAYLRN